MRLSRTFGIAPESRVPASRRTRDADTESAEPLKALQAIETIDQNGPFRIVPIVVRQGTVSPASEVMIAKVKWARRAGYSVLTRDVPNQFAPYNAIIRVSERGTEDHNRDYLARIVD